MMLQNISASEYVEWIAYFSTDWTAFKPDQTPDQIQANLALSLAAVKKKKKAKKTNAT